MKKYRIEIDLDKTVYGFVGTNPSLEVAQILTELVRDIHITGSILTKPLRDDNGDIVGRAFVEK